VVVGMALVLPFAALRPNRQTLPIARKLERGLSRLPTKAKDPSDRDRNGADQVQHRHRPPRFPVLETALERPRLHAPEGK